MKTKITLGAAVGMLFVGVSGVAFSTVTCEELIDGLAQREQQLQNVRGEFHLTVEMMWIGNQTIEFEKRYTWIKKNEMQKVTDEFVTIPQQFLRSLNADPNSASQNHAAASHVIMEKLIHVLDGAVTTEFKPESGQARISNEQDLFYKFKKPADWLLPTMKQTMFLSAYLKSAETTAKYKGMVRLEDRDAYMVEFTANGWEGQLYLAETDTTVMPLRLERIFINAAQTHSLQTEYVFNDYKQYGNVMLPTTVTAHHYKVYPGEKQLTRKEIFTVTEMDVNIEIPDTQVQLEFPAGTMVIDLIANESYIIDENSVEN